MKVQGLKILHKEVLVRCDLVSLHIVYPISSLFTFVFSLGISIFKISLHVVVRKVYIVFTDRSRRLILLPENILNYVVVAFEIHVEKLITHLNSEILFYKLFNDRFVIMKFEHRTLSSTESFFGLTRLYAVYFIP